MQMMTTRTALLGMVLTASLAGGATFVAQGATSETQATPFRGGASQPQVDVSGPCDEAEHANDPECAGNNRSTQDDGARMTGGDEAKDVLEPGEDISGPCDEAEHANDPECAGLQPTQDNEVQVGDEIEAEDVLEPAEDISGPCDEAEHANDPRCTGVQTGDTDDNPGPGSHDAHEDASNDNSGPGSGDEDDDNSGPGSGDED
ncbi:MAG: hypothetical protein H0W21_08900 [Actinobacteria bacterium]|nr:hypothetical protein [Actinomycetota bacterium]